MDVRCKAKITSKGQITLPQAVRQYLGVSTGDVVIFELSDAGINLARDREPGVIDKWSGRLRRGQGRTRAEIDR